MALISEDRQSIAVLVVLVIYRRNVNEAASWPMLTGMINQIGDLTLKHCLVFDNSPQEVGKINPDMPEGFELRLSHQNVGTSGAYICGIEVAKAQECEWLLLLDQDTELPPDYLALAAASLEGADVLVPKIWHDRSLISPSIVTNAGSIRPVEHLPKNGTSFLTAISSGVLAKACVIEACLPFPETLWLDYVDHWMFLSFSRKGYQVRQINADLSHDLSIKKLETIGTERVKSILRSETEFYRSLGLLARSILPMRQAMRGVRYFFNGRGDLAIITFLHCINGIMRR